MAEETFLSRATARELARKAVETMVIPPSAGTAGTYQSPKKSKILAEIENCFAGEGLTRASHLQAWVDVVERVRVTEYTAASAGNYEDPDLNLSRQATKRLPQADLFVRPETAQEIFDLVQAANFTP